MEKYTQEINKADYSITTINNGCDAKNSSIYIYRTSELGFSGFLLKESYKASIDMADNTKQINGTIYKITNKINGKIYIGQTKVSLQRRIGNHNSQANFYKKNNIRRAIIVDRAIAKYGKENMVYNYVEINIKTQKDLNDAERFWIKYYNSTNLEIGYNLKEGGDCCEMSEETKKKISKANKGKRTGEEAYNYGKPLPKEHRQKISKSNIGRKSKREHTKSELLSYEKQRKLSKQQTLELLNLYFYNKYDANKLSEIFKISKALAKKIISGISIYDRISIDILRSNNLLEPIDIEIRNVRKQIAELEGAKIVEIIDNKNITKELKIQILTDIKNGKAIIKTCLEYGVKFNTVFHMINYNYCYNKPDIEKDKFDICIDNLISHIKDNRFKHKISQEEELQILKYYKEKIPVRQISKICNRGITSIWRIIKRQ